MTARRRRPGADPVRRAAYDLLRAVADRDAYANLVLPRLLSERGLTGRDAAFATELGYGALRGRGRLDAVLARCVDRPLDRLDRAVHDVLRLGAYQLLETRVPAHAAVSSTVQLAHEVTGAGPARLINAVLRRVAARSLTDWLAEVAPAYDDDPVGHLAVVTSHPVWVVEAFRAALGGDLDETRTALEADNDRPQVTLVARPGRLSFDELLAAAGAGAAPGRYSPYAVRVPSGRPADLAAVRTGAAGVQDEGSQLAALALAAAPLDGTDRTWVDLCAGPGGKAALLSGLLEEHGQRGQRGEWEQRGRLLAIELAAHRARLVAGTLAGCRAALAVQADGAAPPLAPGTADRVLVDAPCSGLGALRRRPEARWRRTPGDLAGLGRLQRRLLRAALTAVRPGGVVGYVTCSPHLAETTAVVRDVVAGVPGLQPVDVPDLLLRWRVTDARAAAGEPWAQLWPHRHGTDAMFIALLRSGAPAH